MKLKLTANLQPWPRDTLAAQLDDLTDADARTILEFAHVALTAHVQSGNKLLLELDTKTGEIRVLPWAPREL